MVLANQNNKLIRKSILSMFPGSLAAMVTVSVAMMADTILAGAIFNKFAIAAVAVGMPIINIFQALTQTIINGSSIKMNVSAGKGENDEVNKSYASSIFYTVICGLIFVAVAILFAEKLVVAFGGTEEVADLAAWYLRGSAGCIVIGNLNMFMSKTLALYGEQKVIFRSSFLAVALNVVFSLIFTKILPENMAIMGLGFGTWIGGGIAALSSHLSLRKYGLTLKFKLKDAKISSLIGFIHHGLPSSGNNLADGVVSGIVNNIIVNGFKNGVVALSVFTAVKSISMFATSIIMAINLSATPLFGIMYGSRDKNGIVRSYKESIRLSVIALLICSVVIAIISPFLSGVFDMRGETNFYIGLLICTFVFLPLTAIVRITAQFFESIEKPGMGLLYSAIPDSVIFPILLVILLPLIGYTGIWISYSLNAIPFLIGLYALRSVKNKTLRLSYDRFFCLDEEIRDNVPKIDISIKSNNKDVSFISEEVHTFLAQEGVEAKTAHTTALCLEELSADFVEHTAETVDTKKAEKVIMDVKLFSDKDMLRIIIRNEADKYNPLDFELDSESFRKMGVKLAQRLAQNIKYTYVYRMNIITIDIAKNPSKK